MRSKLLLKKKKKQREIVLLTRHELNAKLAQLMRRHIGQDNFITKEQIFRELFGEPKNYSNAQVMVLMKIIIPRAMNWLRKTTKCFIVHKRLSGYTYGYYLPRNRTDISYYDSFLKNLEKKIQYMRERAEKSIAEGWYREFQ